ncbi:MAG TPA: hydroxyacylglutathione hydrolase [Polyangiales bacterium]|nr:hydroxyacylglutathione hydrolase [Polyangiales bacterium]
MRIQIVPCLADNYAYVLVHDNGDAVVVDPSEADPVIAAIETNSLHLVGIWLTHHHHDHVGGVEELARVYPRLEVHASEHDRAAGRIRGVTRGLREHDPLWFGSRRVRVLEVPGHTLGAIAYVVDGVLFSGDTLFSSGCGRLFEGTPELMQASLAKLRTLDPATQLHPGHEYAEKNLSFAQTIEPNNHGIRERAAEVKALRDRNQPSVPTTLAQELELNPFLRWDDPVVIARARELGAPDDAPAHVFAAIRRARDSF